MWISTIRTLHDQGHNHRENLGATAPMVGRICPPGWNRVKVSENLGSTAVAPVAPVDIPQWYFGMKLVQNISQFFHL